MGCRSPVPWGPSALVWGSRTLRRTACRGLPASRRGPWGHTRDGKEHPSRKGAPPFPDTVPTPGTQTCSRGLGQPAGATGCPQQAEGPPTSVLSA